MNLNNPFSSDELITTEDLLKDFSANEDLTPTLAIKLAWQNYNEIENEFLVPRTELLDYFLIPNYWYKLIRFIHFHIFDGVYSNSGEFRSSIDRNKGAIFFGGQHNRENKANFEGSSPSQIQEDVENACKSFAKSDEEPLKKVLKLYQQLMKIHPFYDGNGRVGRVLTNHYLFSINKYLNWSKFDNQNKFLRKLNDAHRTDNIENFYNFSKKYLVDIDELEQ